MSNPAYLKTCECENKYIADGKPICLPCRRVLKYTKRIDLANKRQAKYKAKQEKRLVKKNKNSNTQQAIYPKFKSKE